MTETEQYRPRYSSTRGLNYESVPWKLWEKSKKLFLQNPDENEQRAAEKGRKLQKVH